MARRRKVGMVLSEGAIGSMAVFVPVCKIIGSS